MEVPRGLCRLDRARCGRALRRVREIVCALGKIPHGQVARSPGFPETL